jgi:hypothetical protein
LFRPGGILWIPEKVENDGINVVENGGKRWKIERIPK